MYQLPPRRKRYAKRSDKLLARTRLSLVWKRVVRRRAATLISRCPWDILNVDDNRLVKIIEAAILDRGRSLYGLAEAVIAVMAWTDDVVPQSWFQALRQLTGPTQMRLCYIFAHFKHPARNDFWRKLMKGPLPPKTPQSPPLEWLALSAARSPSPEAVRNIKLPDVNETCTLTMETWTGKGQGSAESNTVPVRAPEQMSGRSENEDAAPEDQTTQQSPPKTALRCRFWFHAQTRVVAERADDEAEDSPNNTAEW